MRKRLMTLLCICVLIQFLVVGTCFAAPQPDLNSKGSISVDLRHGGSLLKGGSLSFYRVGEITVNDGDLNYQLTGDYKASGVSLKDPEDAETAESLREYTEKNKIKGDTVAVNYGHVVYHVPAGKLGLYLVVQTEACEGFYELNPFLIAVPSYHGGYDYAVDASPKMGIPEPKPEVPPEPENPENPDEHGGLDEDDNNGGGNENGNTEDGSLNGGGLDGNGLDGNHAGGNKLPQTGQLNWPIPVLAGLGTILFLVGWSMRKREKRDEV